VIIASGTLWDNSRLSVVVEAQQGDKWVKLNEGSTNDK